MSEISEEPKFITSQKTLNFRLKRSPENAHHDVLQQWNQCSDGTGYWEDVPVVYTSNDKEFECE